MLKKITLIEVLTTGKLICARLADMRITKSRRNIIIEQFKSPQIGWVCNQTYQ